MSYLCEWAIDSFVLLRANWTVSKTLQLLQRVKATHIVVHRTEPDIYQPLSQEPKGIGAEIHLLGEVKDYYYLYTIEEARRLLLEANREMFVSRAFNLQKYSATPVRNAYDTYMDEEQAPDYSIVMDEGRIVGVIDPLVPPGWMIKFRNGALMRFKFPIRTTPEGSIDPKNAARKGKDLSTEQLSDEEVDGYMLPGLDSLNIEDEGIVTRGSGLEPITTEPLPRTLRADFPDQVPLQQTVSLLVSLLAELETSETVQGKLPIAVPIGATIDIFIQPKSGFAIDGNSEAKMVVSDEEEIVQFKLKAIDLGAAEVRVLAFYGGQRLGVITLRPAVVEASQPVGTERVVQERAVVVLSVQEPDLSLLIFEHQSGGQPTLTFRLRALDPQLGLNFKPFGPVTLSMNPVEYFNDLFIDIENLQVKNAHDKAVAQKKLEAKGATLFRRVIPPDLQVLLWSLRNRIQFVQVQSWEPWIPWELCKLQGKENGRVKDGPFFCEAFAMTRWLLDIGIKPALSLRKMALVIPKDSGLPYAASERDYMLSLASGERRVERIPATFLDVKEALSKGEYDAWHFTGHGGFRGPDPNRSAILLENREEMTPEDLSDETSNLGLAKPLVFLNACQIGRGGMSLTDIGGWAAQFLYAGAGAFIGAYWSIYDQAANNFAQTFYQKLLSGMEISKAVKEARQSIKPLGDSTWLAYTVFADPLARIC